MESGLLIGNVSVIVSSCDAFSDCWVPLIYSVKQFWPSVPYDIYIVSNYLSIEDEIVKFVKVGEDKGWASNLKKALSEIEADYILYLQEDYWLTKAVNTPKLLSQIEYCEAKGVDYLRINIPFSNHTKVDDQHAVCSLGKDKYAICLQAAIWKKSTLEKLLVEGWSGWDYEAKACQYAIDNNIPIKAEVVLSDADDDLTLHYVEGTAVRKGKWTRNGAAFLRENGFSDLLSKRKTEGWMISHLADWRNYPLLHYPTSGLIRLMNNYNLNF